MSMEKAVTVVPVCTSLVGAARVPASPSEYITDVSEKSPSVIERHESTLADKEGESNDPENQRRSISSRGQPQRRSQASTALATSSEKGSAQSVSDSLRQKALSKLNSDADIFRGVFASTAIDRITHLRVCFRIADVDP